jgi:hypothetical protein
MTRIRKAQVGRTVDFKSSQSDEQVINGVIERVKNRIATIRFYVVRANDGTLRTFNQEGFTAYLPVSDIRIVEVY